MASAEESQGKLVSNAAASSSSPVRGIHAIPATPLVSSQLNTISDQQGNTQGLTEYCQFLLKQNMNY